MIPQLQGDATEQTPPDLPSYLFKERIVYLVSQAATSNKNTGTTTFSTQRRAARLLLLQGMSLVPAVTELILAELLYLQYDNPTRPVYMYINSAGVTVSPCTCCMHRHMISQGHISALMLALHGSQAWSCMHSDSLVTDSHTEGTEGYFADGMM